MDLVERHKHTAASLLFLILSFSVFASVPSNARNSFQQASDKDAARVASLAGRLKSSNEEERREAVMVLSSIKGQEALSLLESALADDSPRVRAAAVDGLALRRDPSAVPLLALRLKEDKDQSVRKAAAYALGPFRGGERTAALASALRDKDLEVRGAAAVALAEYADGGAIPALISALSDKSAFVRAHAARALGVNRAAAAQAVPTLIRLLDSDEDHEVKRQVAGALGEIGDRSAIPALERARGDRDPYLTRIAAASIKRIKREE